MSLQSLVNAADPNWAAVATLLVWRLGGRAPTLSFSEADLRAMLAAHKAPPIITVSNHPDDGGITVSISEVWPPKKGES